MLFSQKQKINEVYADDMLLKIDDEIRKDIQQSLLNMLIDIQNVCLRNHITVYLCGGSALGAHRHKGFIPWDDDVDISMTRSDYYGFQKVFEKELSDRYSLIAPNYSKKSKSRFPKIMKKGTVFREAGDRSDVEYCGLFLDIFIIDNVPDCKAHRLFKGILCNGMEFIAGQVILIESGPEWRKICKRAGKWSYYMRFLCGLLFSFRTSSGWYDWIDRIIQHGDEKSEYCTLATGSKHYFGESLKRSVFFPAKTADFEGKIVYVFQNLHEYLLNLYGADYMIIPDETKRQSHLITELILG